MKLNNRTHLGRLSTYIPMLFIALTIFISACDDDDDMTAPQDNIVMLAQGNSDLSILVQALTKYPDLVSTLSGSGEFTVFAPTNAAFTSLLGVIGQDDLDNIPESVLRRVLEYHVISGGAILSSSLTDGQTAATVLGENITVGVSSGGVSIDAAKVITPDIAASNGVVHVIDAVLVPALEASIVNTVVEPAYFNKDFSTLTAAVIEAGLLTTLIDPTANFTVFAPTNEAFTAAGITALPTAAELVPILQYHVLSTEVKAAGLPATGSAVPTLNGSFYLSKNTSGVFINGLTKVIATDIDQSNGVVHVIDRTLLPASQNVVDIAVAASTATNAEFGQLVAALTAVENDGTTPSLITALSAADGSFTVFAPTDAAFNALYTLAGVANFNELVTAVGIGTIATVLQYHVLDSRVFSTDIPNALDGNASVVLTPLAGGDFTLNSTLTITDADAALTLGTTDAGIVDTDILGTNGVIHVINQVLLP